MFNRRYLELGTRFRKRRLEMGADCFTKGLPLQAEQRQPSHALAFSPNGYYRVKFCVFLNHFNLSRFIYSVYSVRDCLAENSCE